MFSQPVLIWHRDTLPDANTESPSRDSVFNESCNQKSDALLQLLVNGHCRHEPASDQKIEVNYSMQDGNVPLNWLPAETI